MTAVEILRFAVRGLAANRMRSLLTMLGIFIGVAAVVLLMAIGNGAGQEIERTIGSLGSNTVTVFPSIRDTDGPQVQRRDLTMLDAAALEQSDAAPAVARVVPVVQTSAQATFGLSSLTVPAVTGTSADYLGVVDADVIAGLAWTADDVAAARNVALIGQTVRDELFGATDPLGQRVQLNRVPFTVVGVLGEVPDVGIGDANNLVVAPISAVQQTLTGFGPLSSIMVQAVSAADVSAAEAQVTAILDARHLVSDPAERDYELLNQATLLDAISTVTNMFTTLLAAIAALSLLVGGIGITNIMLMTVAERTREIGIRKAIGAPRGAILGQFLLEATLLSLLGAAFGVIAGIAASRITIAGLEPIVMPSSIVLAFTVAVTIGLFFGAYPANRAAKLRPIDALRHE